MVRTVEDVEFEIKTLRAQINELNKKIAAQDSVIKKAEAIQAKLSDRRGKATGKFAGLSFEATVSKIMAGDVLIDEMIDREIDQLRLESREESQEATKDEKS